MTTLERIPSGVAAPTTTVSEVLSLAREAGVLIVDLRFVDLPGQAQHFSIPVKDLGEDLFIDGIGFDGSSIRGFQHIHESDMLLMPDPTTAYVDPTLDIPTLILSCDVVEPGSREPYSRDPRYVARKAERYLAESGIATTSFWGPEVEFYIFDSPLRDCRPQVDVRDRLRRGHLELEPQWDAEPRPPPAAEGRLFPRPADGHPQDLRSRMVLALQASGIDVEVQHHEVGGPGQAEIDIRYGTLVETADKVLRYKYIVKQVAHAAGKVATFLPKPLYGDNGSGMHTPEPVEGRDEPLLRREGLRSAVRHRPLVYRRPAAARQGDPRLRRADHQLLSPPGARLRGADQSRLLAAEPLGMHPHPDVLHDAGRASPRVPLTDPTCNPYLSFSAQLLAGLDGIINKVEPPAPIDADIYELSAEEKAGIDGTPGSLEEALDALEADQEFLYRGDVFTKDVVDAWLDFKRAGAKEIQLRPHPYEFYLYSEM